VMVVVNIHSRSAQRGMKTYRSRCRMRLPSSGMKAALILVRNARL
jgi:hypothetical protein